MSGQLLFGRTFEKYEVKDIQGKATDNVSKTANETGRGSAETTNTAPAR
jgi:hypothetical protein